MTEQEQYFFEILRNAVPWYMTQHHRKLLEHMFNTRYYVTLKGRNGLFEETRLWDGIYYRRDHSDLPLNLGESYETTDLDVNVLEVWAGFLKRACGDILPIDSEKNMFYFTMQNLGLIDYDDDHYDEEKVDRIIEKWLDRKYGKDGVGSPFPLYTTYTDDINMRRLDLWKQADLWWMENDPVDEFVEYLQRFDYAQEIFANVFNQEAQG